MRALDAILSRITRTRPTSGPRVCVLFPRGATDADHLDHATYQDGAIQELAFYAAIEHYQKVTGRRDEVLMHGINKNLDGPTIVDIMRMYHGFGIRYFVMTMSESVRKVQQPFREWRAACRTTAKPVPIATVAAASGLANIEAGIVRYYLRTEEEITELARYLMSELDTQYGAAFCIDSTYGIESVGTFQKILLPVPLGNDQRLVTASDAKSVAKAWYLQWRASCERPAYENMRDHTGVLVAGYGPMIAATIDGLVEAGFSGPIACTSTLTHTEWQPKVQTADSRTYTVLPLLANEGFPDGKDRNVVYCLARRTLIRVLSRLPSLDNSDIFLERWLQRGPCGNVDANDHPLAESFVQDETGDIQIRVRYVDHTRWRLPWYH